MAEAVQGGSIIVKHGSWPKKNFLQHGGAREPADILNGLVGDGVLRYCNGGIVPDITSLRDEMKLVSSK